MQGTKRSSESTAWVGESLAKLGQQVGASLAEREQQKQAQEMLPFLQQSMQESMKLAQDGDTAGAYSNMMGIFAANPDLMRNKAALPFFELGLNGIKESAQVYKQTQDYNQRQAYYDKVTANKTGDGNTPSVDAPRYGFGNISSVDNETVTPLPDPNLNQPVEEMPENAGATMPRFTGGFSASLNEPTQEGTPAQIAGRKNVEGILTLPPEEQQNAAMSFAVTNFNPDQYELRNIAGVSKYHPNFLGYLVPKESWKETTAILSGEGELSRNSKLTAPEARENFLKQEGTEFAVKKAVKTMEDKTMISLFNDYGKDIYALRASTDQKDDPRGQEPIFTVTGKDGKDKRITKDQYAAIETLAGIIPAVAENAGGTPALFKPSGKTVEDKYPVKKTEEPTEETSTTSAQPTPPPDQPTPFDEAVTQKQTEKQTQETVAAKKSLENQKTKIENSISELQDKAKILNAVAQKNITTLPEYLKKRMSSYMNATPARNKQDFLDTRKQIEELKTELDSLKEKILESSK